MERLSNSLEDLPMFSDEQDDLSVILESAHRLPFDPEGRVALPKDVLKTATVMRTPKNKKLRDLSDTWPSSQRRRQTPRSNFKKPESVARTDLKLLTPFSRNHLAHTEQ